MKALALIALMMIQSTFAQAVLLPYGTPRPIEQAPMVVTEATNGMSGPRGAQLVRVGYEQTKNQGFILTLNNAVARFAPLEFQVVSMSQGQCGETIYKTVNVSRAGMMNRFGVPPTLEVVDNRTNRCRYITSIPVWYARLTMATNSGIGSMTLEGTPEIVFSPMATIR